jgi:hypothetical protein
MHYDQRLATSIVGTHTVTLSATLADVVVALSHHAVETDTEDALAEALDVLHAIVTTVVSDATHSISPSFVTRAAMKPLLERVQNMESPLEVEIYDILADIGLALDFRNGKALAVRYPDRLFGSQDGLTRPDSYHPWTRLAVFCDSTAHHSSSADRSRDNGVNSACILRGIIPLRFTTEQIRFAREEVAATILAHLGKRARRADAHRADAA